MTATATTARTASPRRSQLGGIAGLLLAIVALGALLVVAVFAMRDARTGWSRYDAPAAPGSSESALAHRFLSDDAVADRYEALFLYFVDGFVTHSAAGGSRVQYPGLGSRSGYASDGLEGFARTAPLLAAWVAGGRPQRVTLPDGRQVDLLAVLDEGLREGLNPSADGYWGAIEDPEDQRVVEATDVARLLWMTRDRIWSHWSADDRARAVSWLDAVRHHNGRAGNWRLFPVIVDLILEGLGAPGERSAAARDALDSYRADHYLGNGWFSDDPRGVDYYNAWSISYELFWIVRVAPHIDSGFIRDTLAESADLTAHLISPDGIPILGRSLCYRTAVPVPVIAAELLDRGAPGRGRRALDATWRYFVARGALAGGALTQGYFVADPRILDNYSGSGSCHWGLRSLTLAFLNAPDSPFWQSAPVRLPIEQGDYELDLPALGWRVVGNSSTQEIAIELPGNDIDTAVLDPWTLKRRLESFVRRGPNRPANRRAKYDLSRYSSARPFMVDGGPATSLMH